MSTQAILDSGCVRVGVIGAGVISEIYLHNITQTFGRMKLMSVCAAHLERARIKADKYGVKACTLDEMLEDPEVDLVIVLTPVDTHYEIIRKALLAGKHVYTEKTIAQTLTQAKELCALAAEKGLRLGSAPDTFLSPAFETARKAVDDGLIGTVNSFSISINRNNDFLTALLPFLRLPGAGVLRDYMVYYLTALYSILGPAEKTCAFIQAPYQTRINTLPGSVDFGQEISTPEESIVTAILQLENGIIGTVHLNSETVGDDQADFVLFGTKGMLLLGNPNLFTDPVRFIPVNGDEKAEIQVLPPVGFYSVNSRGLGAAEMMEALVQNRPHRASMEMASHVLDTLECMEKSCETGCVTSIQSTFNKPEFFDERL